MHLFHQQILHSTKKLSEQEEIDLLMEKSLAETKLSGDDGMIARENGADAGDLEARLLKLKGMDASKFVFEFFMFIGLELGSTASVYM